MYEAEGAAGPKTRESAAGRVTIRRLTRVVDLCGVARLGLAAWALGAFSFTVGHPEWSQRAILSNALTNNEQQVLSLTLGTAVAALGAATLAHMLTARADGFDSAAAFGAISRVALLIGPLGLYPLYHASIGEPALLLVVAALAASAAGGLYLNLADGFGARLRDSRIERAAKVAERALPVVVLALVVVHVALIQSFIRAKFNTFANGWDLAIHNQIQWNIADSGVPWTTMYSNDRENHYSIHFSPIFHLTAFIYALRRVPDTLTLLQNFALASGALPLFFLARHKCKSGWIGLGLAISYLFSPCLHSIAVFEFHEIALLVPLAIWMVWAIESRRLYAFWVFTGLIFILRDDTAIYLGAFAIYLRLTDRRRIALTLGLLAVTYLILTHAAVMPALRHGRVIAFSERFLDLQRPGEHGAGAILSTSIWNPLFCIGYVVRSVDKLYFTAFVMLSVALLPLRAGRALIPCAPGFAFSLMSSFAPQYSIWSHYSSPFLAFLYCATVAGMATLRPRLRPCATVALVLCSVLLSGKYGRYAWLNPTFVERELAAAAARYGTSAERILAVARAVPDDDSVRATNNLLPVLSGRRHAYILPGGAGADWAFIDYRRQGAHGPGTFESARALCEELLGSQDYGVVYLDASVVVLHRGADRSKNEATLLQIRTTDPH